MDKWQQYIDKKVNFVVLNHKLYEVNKGTICCTWLDLTDNHIHKQVPVKLIGRIPNKHKKNLPITGIKLARLSY